jgi:hypothetical protein
MTDIAIDTIDVVTERYSDERYSEFVRMAEVRKLFIFPETKDTQELTFAAPSSKNAPAPQNIMDVINQAQQAPASTSVVAVPTNLTAYDRQNLQDIALLDTYVSVYCAELIYHLNPNGFDITRPNEAATFNKELANARFEVHTKGLASVLSVESATEESFSTTTTAGDLHLEFLGQLFGSFGFSPAALKELKSILRSLVRNLSTLQYSWTNQSETLDHVISTYYFEEVPTFPGVKVPKIRLFYLHIDERSWEDLNHNSSLHQFEFNMKYTDYKCTMLLNKMPQWREAMKAYITSATQQQFDSIQNLVAMSAIRH